MASPNKQHWPSMFRSKHASQLWQPHPDMSSSPPSLVSGCSHHKSHLFSGPEERPSDPKPRWSPRPEQIRILEAIFNSGMVNPPRDEIPRIRMRLQEYGQVGDANVFYWFQNRKSRSKSKQRATAAATRAAPARACASARQQAVAPFTQPQPHPKQPQQLLFSPVAPTSSSSSSSDRSSGSSKPVKPAAQAMSATAAMDLLSPLDAACHQQTHYQLLGQPVVSTPAPAPTVEELVPVDVEPIFLQWPQGHCLSAGELAAILGAQYMQVPVQQPAAASPAGMLLGLCDELAAATSAGHRSSACNAGLGQYWPSNADKPPSLGKNLNTPVSTEEARDDATKLGMLQYGFGISTAPAVNAASAAAVLPLPASPEPAVTVASVAATAGLTSLSAASLATGAVTYDRLQGPGDAAGFAGTATVARGAAAVCIAGTSAMCSVPATHLNVKMYFGDGAVLVGCNGDRAEPLLVDESGLTVEPLQHGAVYYCVLI